MPKVPERPLSPGEIKRTYIRSTASFHGTKYTPEWSYQEPRNNSRNGAVKTTRLPHPFKCSRCLYTGKNGADIKKHWSEEH